MYKRLLSLLTALLLLFSLTSASALTQTEWNQECRSKTKGATTLYALSDDGSMTAVGSLPAGAYIKLGVYDYDLQMWDIAYYAGGSRASAWVMRANVTSAETMVHFSDGTSVSLPEALVADSAALAAYVRRLYPGRTLHGNDEAPDSTGNTSPAAPETPPSPPSGSGTDAGSSASSRPAAARTPQSSGLTALYEGATFPVLELGVYESVILIGGEEYAVPTASLTFADDVPAEKAIAVIHAPSTGKCTLRRAASASAKSLGKCKAGTIVAVLEYGGKFCRIHYGGEVGYVLTSCLKFHGGAEVPVGTGVLTWNGKATGRTTINIRNAADSDAHRIAQWPTGTEVVVFGRDGKWFEIEHDGMHGFVHEDYLTMSE